MTMLKEVRYLTRFKRDVKRLKKQNKDMQKLKTVIEHLMTGEPLPARYKDHPLGGDWNDFRDCHIEPDWVLIYRVTEEALELVLARTGSHSELNL